MMTSKFRIYLRKRKIAKLERQINVLIARREYLEERLGL